MKKTTIKALYLFLCSILGMVLFGMLHRAVFVLYDLLLVVDYETYSFGMAPGAISALDFSTMMIMLFLGGWYGVVLGIEWYAMVYGPNVEKPAGLFHGFLPHHWRGARKAKRKSTTPSSKPTSSFSAPAPETTSTTIKVPVSETHAWSFDDLITPKSALKKKTTTRKTIAKKTAARKTTKRIKTAEVA